ncbi:MAG: hypothetical protein WB661_07680 [Candidatus Bathyarchaeia archaeon]
MGNSNHWHETPLESAIKHVVGLADYKVRNQEASVDSLNFSFCTAQAYWFEPTLSRVC